MKPGTTALAAICAAFAVAGAFAISTRVGSPPKPKAPPKPVETRALDADGWTKAEALAIRRFAPDGSRPARDADATDSSARKDLDALYADYHPYFTRGDLNGDGRLDFVQAYVSLHGGVPFFSVAVFFGRPDGSFEDPVFVERDVSLADGDVSIERSLLLVAPDLAREEMRRWRFEPLERHFVDADTTPAAAEPDDDTPDETPDNQPRARA